MNLLIIYAKKKNNLSLRSNSKNGNYHCLQYNNYSNKALHVFDHNDFHNNKVKHLFTGQDEDGWCKQRDKLFR